MEVKMSEHDINNFTPDDFISKEDIVKIVDDVKREADKLMMNKISKYEKEIADLKKELEEVKADNKKLALQINEMVNRLRDADF
jgi:regulator of replication initiation timing